MITGADPAFCSGDDVKKVMGGGEGKPAAALAREPRLTPAAGALLATDVPVIAAVNGAAVGWGMELALLADLRVASERARFGELFVLRGLCCDVAGLARLAALVGREKAAELLFTGEVIDAAEALRIGLVSRVVPARRAAARPRSRSPSGSPPTRRSPSRASRPACARRSIRTGTRSAPGCRARSARCSRPKTTAKA